HEEVRLVTKLLDRVPTSEAEESRAKECIARLTGRVRASQGSQADYDLLARIICDAVELKARSIESFDEPKILFYAGTGRHNTEGFGVVIVPTVTVNNVELSKIQAPVFVPGGEGEISSGGCGEYVDVKKIISKPGRVYVTCSLELHLVKERKNEDSAK